MKRLLDRNTNLIVSVKSSLPDRPMDDRKKDRNQEDIKKKEIPEVEMEEKKSTVPVKISANIKEPIRTDFREKETEKEEIKRPEKQEKPEKLERTERQ